MDKGYEEASDDSGLRSKPPFFDARLLPKIDDRLEKLWGKLKPGHRYPKDIKFFEFFNKGDGDLDNGSSALGKLKKPTVVSSPLSPNTGNCRGANFIWICKAYVNTLQKGSTVRFLWANHPQMYNYLLADYLSWMSANSTASPASSSPGSPKGEQLSSTASTLEKLRQGEGGCEQSRTEAYLVLPESIQQADPNLRIALSLDLAELEQMAMKDETSDKQIMEKMDKMAVKYYYDRMLRSVDEWLKESSVSYGLKLLQDAGITVVIDQFSNWAPKYFTEEEKLALSAEQKRVSDQQDNLFRRHYNEFVVNCKNRPLQGHFNNLVGFYSKAMMNSNFSNIGFRRKKEGVMAQAPRVSMLTTKCFVRTEFALLSMMLAAISQQFEENPKDVKAQHDLRCLSCFYTFKYEKNQGYPPAEIFSHLLKKHDLEGQLKLIKTVVSGKPVTTQKQQRNSKIIKQGETNLDNTQLGSVKIAPGGNRGDKPESTRSQSAPDHVEGSSPLLEREQKEAALHSSTSHPDLKDPSRRKPQLPAIISDGSVASSTSSSGEGSPPSARGRNLTSDSKGLPSPESGDTAHSNIRVLPKNYIGKNKPWITSDIGVLLKYREQFTAELKLKEVETQLASYGVTVTEDGSPTPHK